VSPTAPFLPTAEEMGERTPAETTFLHFLSALYLLVAVLFFPHAPGIFLSVVSFPTVPAQLSAAAACYYGKNYSFCCVAGYYILCPTGTPTHCGASHRNGRDLIIATRPAHQPLPSLLSAAAAQAVQAIPEPTTMSPTAPIPRNQHRQICACPPRAKGPLDRRSKWFSLVTFFLQKKKVTRAGARNAPSRARRRNTCSPLSVFPHVTGVFLIVVVPPTVPAQLSAAAACYYGKHYSFCRVAG